MPTYPRSESPEEIERRIKEGRGSGEKENYKPWIYPYEITSKGNSTSTRSHKLQREVHFFSDLELHFWYVIEYSEIVVDCWEQYPLFELEDTMKIAEEHNIPYPTISDPKNRSIRYPKVLTTDFVVSVLSNNSISYHPISIKYTKPRHSAKNAVSSNTLEDRRSLEKIELERLFWEDKGHKLRIITESDIPYPVWINLKQAHERYEIDLPDHEIHEIASYLTRRIKNESRPLREITSACDHQLGYPEGSGTALTVVWHLIAQHKWIIDLKEEIDPGHPLKLISSYLELS